MYEQFIEVKDCEMKLKRHQKIIDLIGRSEIETQEELARRLHEAGFPATQATVSRDIRELNLRKEINREGRSVYVPAREPAQDTGRYARVLRDAYLSMDAAQNILVIRTASGMAMAVAAVLDELKWEEVLGCIAGDDTIICVVKSEEHSHVVMERLRAFLENV